jgi:hypothetical protein
MISSIVPIKNKVETVNELSTQLRKGVITDSDGYTNIRKSNSVNSEIIGKIVDREVFTYWETNDNWYIVQTAKGIKGYVHKSRIKPEAMAVREVSADSVVQVKVSPTVTEVIGIVPMERDFPVAMPVDFQISSNPCSDIGEEEDKALRDSADRTLMPNFIFPFVMLLKRISRY